MRFRQQTIDYAQRYQHAVLGMIRELLTGVSEEGLPGDHHFYLTFDTNAEGVELSDTLKEHYPELMTIVLQNQFWGLFVDDDGFSVTLRFGGIKEPLLVPWNALVGFADPSVEFALELTPSDQSPFGGDSADPTSDDPLCEEDPKSVDATACATETASESGEAQVVSFEDFKRR